jgi:hypothetical protein
LQRTKQVTHQHHTKVAVRKESNKCNKNNKNNKIRTLKNKRTRKTKKNTNEIKVIIFEFENEISF